MGTHAYQRIASGIPPIPILTVQLFQPGIETASQIDCVSILDTGSDCTLFPLPSVMQAKGQPVQGMTRIPVCGVKALAIPIQIGLVLDHYEFLSTRVFGCSVEEIGELGIIGRDILNRFRIEFDRLELTFQIW